MCVTSALCTQTSTHCTQCDFGGGCQACRCAGSTHISFWGDRQRGWHVQSCFTLFPFYTQTTSHCHHSILQIPQGLFKSTASVSGPMICPGEHVSKEGTFTQGKRRGLLLSKLSYIQNNKTKNLFFTKTVLFFSIFTVRLCDIWIVLHSDWQNDRPSLIVFYNWQSMYHTVNLPACVSVC